MDTVIKQLLVQISNAAIHTHTGTSQYNASASSFLKQNITPCFTLRLKALNTSILGPIEVNKLIYRV